MALWKWRTLPDATVEVDKGDGFKVHEPIPVQSVVATAEKAMQWRELAERKAAEYGIPPSWILAFIFAESGGDPHAANYCCTGLMAIMTQPPVHGKTKEQMLDPEQNVDYGASIIARSGAREGNQLPEVASIHVAGPKKGTADVPKTNFKSPYGMSEHMWLDNPQGDGSVGYIDRVTQANNMFVRLLGQKQVPPPGPGNGDKPAPPPVMPPTPAQAGVGAAQILPFAAAVVIGFIGFRLFYGR